ncbi:hypothetical protein CHS0354_017682 [Potamilus streckersoni]|uniref:Uncharacterized protein n=1 Tax=Potamilus streckersoni TaxID=2493646 RepID=A0AAE0S7S3_9BIVA|nr:hypothetical protein CHS0354_017682 [Potamilus streckersoni]
MDSEFRYQLASQTGLQSQLLTLSVPMMAHTISPKRIQTSPTLQDARVSPQMKNILFDSQLQDLRTLVSDLSNESQMWGANIHSEIEKQHMDMPVNGMNQQIPETSGALKNTLNSEDPRNVISITDPSHLLDTLEDDFGDILNSMEITCSSLQSTPKKNYIEDQLFSPVRMDSDVSLASYSSSVASSQPVTTFDTASTPFIPVSHDCYTSSVVNSQHVTTCNSDNTPFVPTLNVSKSRHTATLPTSIQASHSSMELATMTSSTSQSTPVVYLSGNKLVYPMSSITVKDKGMLLSDNQTGFLLDSQSANASGSQSVNSTFNMPFGSNQYTPLVTFQSGTRGNNYNTEQVTETPTIIVDPIITKCSDTNRMKELQAEMKSATQVTLEETVYALSETDHCQCGSEEKGEEVPVEQIFIRDGQMFRLPDVATIQVGKLDFCGFRKQEKWYLGLAEVMKKVGPIIKKEFEEAVLNARDLDILELDTNEFELLLQRNKMSRKWQLKDMMELKCFRSIFEKLYKESKDPVLKTIAEGPYYKKTDGSQVRCTNCGLKIENASNRVQLEMLLKNDVEAPLFDEHYTKQSSKYQSSVGFLHIIGLNIELNAFRLKGNDYISLKEIVFKKIFNLTTMQKRLLHLQVRPIRAPSEIEYYFQLHDIEVKRTLWVDIVAVRCMCCLTGMKELDVVTRALSCGQFKYKEMLTLITEDTTMDDTVFTLDEESLEICRFNEKLTLFETKKTQPTQTDMCATSQMTGRRNKYRVCSSNRPDIIEASVAVGSGQALSKVDDSEAVYVKIASMDKRGKPRAVSHIKQNLKSAPVTARIPLGKFIVEDLDTFLYNRCAITKPYCNGRSKNAEKSKIDHTEDAKKKTNSDSCNNEDLLSKVKVAADSSYVKENDLPGILQKKTHTSYLVSAKSSNTVFPNTKNSSTIENFATPFAFSDNQQNISANANLKDIQANPTENNAKVSEVEESKSQKESSTASVGKVPPGSIAPGLYIVKDMESFLKSLQKEKSNKASKTAKTCGTSKTSVSNKSKHCQNGETYGRELSEPSVQKDHINVVDTRVKTRKEICPSGECEGSFVSNTSDVCWEKFKVSDTSTSQTKDRYESIEEMDNSYHVQASETLSTKYSLAATVKDASPKISKQKEMSTKGFSSSSSTVFNITARDKDNINSNTQKTASSFSPFTELGLDKPLSENEKMQSPKQLFSVTDKVLQTVPSLETVTHAEAYTAENPSLTPPNSLKTALSTSKKKSKSPIKLKVRMNFSKAAGTPMELRCQRNLSFILDKSNKEKCSVEKSDSATSYKTEVETSALEESESLRKKNVAFNSTVHRGDESVRIQDSSKEPLHTNPNLQEKAVVKLNESEIFDASCVSNLSDKSCSVSSLCVSQNEYDEVMEHQECAEINLDKDEDIYCSKSSFNKSDTSEFFERDVTPVTITSSSSRISNDTGVEVLEERRTSSPKSQISENPNTPPSHDTKAASASSPRLQKLSTKIASLQQASAPGDSLQMLAAIAEAMNDDSDVNGSNITGASGDIKNKQRKFPIDISSLDTEQRKVFAIKLKEKMEEMLFNIKKYIEVRKCEGSNEMFKVRMRFKPGAEKVFPALVKPGAKEKRQQFVMVLSRILARKFWSSQLASQELKTSNKSDMAAGTSTWPESKEDLETLNENKEQRFKDNVGGTSDSESCAGNEVTIPVSESKLSVSKLEEEIHTTEEMFISEKKQDSVLSLEQIISPKVYDRSHAVCGRDKVVESNSKEFKEFNVECQTFVGKEAGRALRSKKRPAEGNCSLSNSKMQRK